MNTKLDQQKLSSALECIDELNKRYAVVNFGGKTLIMDDSAEEVQPMTPADFKQLYLNRRVIVGETTKPLGDYWLKHTNRRQYVDGVIFDPGRSPSIDGYYNLWTGFDVEPDASGSCSLFLEHLQQVICSGNTEYYDYMLNWLALMVQRPYQLPGVAIVLLSAEGTGKGLFMSYVGRILGRHYKRTDSKQDLVGRFSGHLHNVVLLFADEIAWQEDKDAAGALKGLITESMRLMEKKHANAVSVKNCIHLVMASNESWVVPAGLTDRRYCVLDVSPTRIGDVVYFQNLVKEMESGGPEALLALLMSRDINGFNPGDFPKTRGRLKQQLQSLDPIRKWVFECLDGGEVSPSAPGWPSVLTCSQVGDSAKDFVASLGARHGVQQRDLRQILERYGVVKDRRSINGVRQYCYVFPDLNDMRRAFEQEIGAGIEWCEVVRAS